MSPGPAHAPARDEGDETWETPALVGAVALAGGVQIPFLVQMLGGTDYLAEALLLKLGSLAVLGVGGWLLATGQRIRLTDGPPRLVKVASPAWPPPRTVTPAGTPSTSALAPGTASAGASPPPATAGTRMTLVLETPLSRGPVWPPGEPLPVTVEVRAAGAGAGERQAAEGLDVELILQHAGGEERAHVPLRGSAAVVSQTIPVPGAFALRARALRHGSVVAEAMVEGVATPYREEVGRRFEALRAQAQRAGLAVGPDATPREVRDALARRMPGRRAALDELLAALEQALYAQEDVGRETYERLVRALREVERHGLEAAPRA